jgi:hypothetical protein
VHLLGVVEIRCDGLERIGGRAGGRRRSGCLGRAPAKVGDRASGVGPPVGELAEARLDVGGAPVGLGGLLGGTLGLVDRVRRDTGVLTLEQLHACVRLELRLALDLAGAARQPPEQIEPQELGENVAARLRVADEELGELALGQQHRPGEGVVVEADRVADARVDVAHAVRALPCLFPVPAARRLELDLRRAAQRRRSRDAVPIRPDGELEHHAEPRLSLADELARLSADSIDRPEERIGDRVEDRRLARAGRPRDREQVEAREVDRLLVPEGGESLDVEPQGPHYAPSVSRPRTSSNASSRPADGAAPCCAP